VRLVEVGGREGVDDPIGAHAEGLLHVEADREGRARVDDLDPDPEVAIAHLEHDGRYGGYDGADGRRSDAVQRETGLANEGPYQEPHLVDGPFGLRGDAPVVEELSALEEPDQGLGVSDVEGQDHG